MFEKVDLEIFTPQQKAVFNVLNSPSFDVKTATLPKIAEKSLTSIATVRRTIEKLGFQKFSTFQSEMLYQISKRQHKKENINLELIASVEPLIKQIKNDGFVVALNVESSSFHFLSSSLHEYGIKVISITNFEQYDLIKQGLIINVSNELCDYEKCINIISFIDNSFNPIFLSEVESEFRKINTIYQIFKLYD